MGRAWRMRMALMVLACAVCAILTPAHSVAMLDEGAVDIGDSETVVQQMDALFSGTQKSDLGEGSTVADSVQQPPRGKRISFQYRSATSHPNLGESEDSKAIHGKGERAKQMVQFGDLLEVLQRRRPNSRGAAVSSLNQAIKTKLLMDELHQAGGSFATTQSQKDLGEGHSKESNLPSFTKMMHSQKKNMEDITKYLLERKKEGNPLTTHEDSELQKFYYNRASTILKRIVLLKKGDSPPKEFGHGKAHDDETVNQVAMARESADAVVDRLRFDAKVANANAAYNKKMLGAQRHRQKAAAMRHKKAQRDSLLAAQAKLMYDRKVADAETKYNQAMSTELVLKKNRAEDKVKEAEKEKVAADKASAKATAEANEADKEAAEAEKEAEAATKKAQDMMFDGNNNHKKASHRVRGNTSTQVHIPVTVTPRAHLKSLVRYLQTAITKHAKITPQEQQLMQSFFIKHGSSLLSSLAQVDPDATWHSKGVMMQEQYEMDHKHPDRLSQEWGSKNLKADTVMKDFMHDALAAHKSKTKLARPGAEQAIGLFGSNVNLPLHFAPDASKPLQKQPSMDLGESNSNENDQKTVHGAWPGMIGVGELDE